MDRSSFLRSQATRHEYKHTLRMRLSSQSEIIQKSVFMNPIRYSPEVEQKLEGEQDIIEQLEKVLTGMQETVCKHHGHAMRATHSKATGLFKGELVILDDLPGELAQGLFAQPGHYEVLFRFSQGPSEPTSDKASGERGMSLKVLGVNGPHLSESREKTTQDFILAPDPSFVNATAKSFLTNFGAVASKSVHLPQAAIIAGSRVARATEAVLEKVGSGNGNLRFFGSPPNHPVGITYYSQAPIRFGDYIAKIAAFPSQATLAAIGELLVDTGSDDNAFREALVGFFGHNSAEFELRAQLCTDLETMPVENAALVWPEDQSPYRPIARLVLPQQNAYTEARRQYFDERLAFNPAHALEEHRPLGSIMRARMQTYVVAQEFRQRENGVSPAEPKSCADVPD